MSAYICPSMLTSQCAPTSLKTLVVMLRVLTCACLIRTCRRAGPALRGGGIVVGRHFREGRRQAGQQPPPRPRVLLRRRRLLRL